MLLPALLLSFAADLIFLKDGRTWTGDVVEEQAERVKIRLPKGAIWVARADIDRIETTAQQRDEYRASAAKAASASDHRALAMWCREKGLAEEEMAEWSAVAAADPANEEAHRALGHVLHEGKWLTPAEAAKAQGLIERAGEWVTPLRARVLDLLDRIGSEDLVERGEAKRELAKLEGDGRAELEKLSEEARARLAAALAKESAIVGALQDRAKAVRGLLTGLVSDEERYIKKAATDAQRTQVREWIATLERIGIDPAGLHLEADSALARDALRLSRADAALGNDDRAAAMRAAFRAKAGDEAVYHGIDPYKTLRAKVDADNRELDLGELERALLDLLALYRLRLGRAPLRWDDKLDACARQHTKEMAELDYFSHVSPVAKYATVAKRFELVGYRSAWIGENLARGNEPPELVLLALQDSPGHHRNLIFGDYSRVAIAREGEFWTMCFGGEPKD
ncbi:MAG: Cysteine-rich secretory protein [Planctomycetota bacterium]|nr:MAG: Cysteine-rich secretory protein [Planctomycetota bacterium]